MSFLAFWNDMLIDAEFKELRDSTYAFGSPGRFVWPYIVTVEQKATIASRLLRPWWIAMPTTLLLGIIATALSKSFEVLPLGGALFCLATLWPRVWVLFHLRNSRRMGPPFALWRPTNRPARLELVLYENWPYTTLVGLLACFGIWTGASVWWLYRAVGTDVAEDVRVAGFSLALSGYLLLAACLVWIGRPEPSKISPGPAGTVS